EEEEWMVHTIENHPVGSEIGLILTPDDIHIMNKMSPEEEAELVSALEAGSILEEDEEDEE
ncbi:MAG: spermidine/putrescine ABC transporter ATP-binding protein, partial [Firmicutes bacterium]|nr:spermidine/putrescine ABC transporter ATP-binding protein [Bacillota bacterium]